MSNKTKRDSPLVNAVLALDNYLNEQNEKLEKFRILSERVRELNTAISEFRRPQGQGLTDEDRATLTSRIPALEAQLVGLIEELQDLRQSARNSRMRALEKNAESL